MYTEDTPTQPGTNPEQAQVTLTKKIQAFGISVIVLFVLFAIVNIAGNVRAQDIDFEANEFQRTQKLANAVSGSFGKIYCMDRIYDINEKIRLYDKLGDYREVARLKDVAEAIEANCPAFALRALENYFPAFQEQRTKTVPPSTETVPSPVKEVVQIASAEPVVSSGVNLDALAKAVARHETASCTRGTGAYYNNCFGIKKGNTAPCSRVSESNFCIYNHKDESFEAFKIIWTQVYGGRMPTLADAVRYSGNDRAQTWLNNVHQFYNEYNYG